MQTSQATSLKLQVIVYGLLGTLCGATFLAAQREVIVPQELQVLDPPNYTYYLGEPFKLNVDYSSSYLKKHRGSLQARIFRGSVEDLMRYGGVSTVDGCKSYMTTVLEPDDYNGGISFDFNFDEYWLGRGGTGKLESGRFVLVFELGGPSEPVLMLRNESVRAYFSRAWSFVVRPRGVVEEESAADVLLEMNKRREEAKAVLKEAGGASAVAAAGEQPEWEDVSRCYKVTGESRVAQEVAMLAAVRCEQASIASAP